MKPKQTVSAHGGDAQVGEAAARVCEADQVGTDAVRGHAGGCGACQELGAAIDGERFFGGASCLLQRCFEAEVPTCCIQQWAADAARSQMVEHAHPSCPRLRARGGE